MEKCLLSREKYVVQSIYLNSQSFHDGAPKTSERNVSFFFFLVCLKPGASHFVNRWSGPSNGEGRSLLVTDLGSTDKKTSCGYR